MRFLLTCLLTLSGTALADEVNIEWDGVEGTSRYELQIKRNQDIILNKDFPPSETTWSGTLPYGEYTYRIRSLDSAQRAGQWSDPIPFLVTPEIPEPILPVEGASILVNPARETSFQWAPVTGITKFQLEIRRDGGKGRRETVDGNMKTVTGLPPGTYSWRVKPILPNKKGQLQALEDKASLPRTFKIESEEDDSPDLDLNQIRLSTPNGTVPFTNGTRVCLQTGRKETSQLGCGRVLLNDGRTALVRLERTISSLVDGKPYFVSVSKESRDTASAGTPLKGYVVALERRRYDYDVGLGVAAGLQYFMVSLHARLNIASGLAAGLRLFYAKDVEDTSSARLLGAFATATYYFGQRSYAGFFGEGAVGGYVFEASMGAAQETGRFTPAGYAVVGWQFRPSSWNFSLATAVGMQYVRPPNITISPVAVSGLLPTVFLNASFIF